MTAILITLAALALGAYIAYRLLVARIKRDTGQSGD